MDWVMGAGMGVRAKMLMLGAVLGFILSGLCLSAHANTTNDDTKAPAAPVTPASVQPATGNSVATPSVDMPAASDAVVAARFTLLLPLQSETFGAAANAVKQGFMAAFEQDRAGATLNVIETSDVPEEVVSSYINALGGSDIMIGPLTRSCAAAIAESGAVRLPTISLTQSDVESDAPTPIPPLMFSIGLSAEDEARQISDWMQVNKTSGKVYAISTSAAWQRRAVKAFTLKQRGMGLEPVVVELGSASGYLSAADLANLKKQVTIDKPSAVFLALTTSQAMQVRDLIGSEAILYGTSQLNSVTLSDRATAERQFSLNGVRLLDIPWQLQPDHPAVMIYPRLVVAADKKRSADMERLYALGIDAYRVARLVAAHRKQFELDGVTGKLIIGFNKDSVHFERVESKAIYREGIATALDDGH